MSTAETSSVTPAEGSDTNPVLKRLVAGARPARRGRAPLAILVLLGSLACGFAVTTQLRGTARSRVNLRNDSPEDLTRILASLTTGADALRDEIGALKLQLLSLQNASRRDAAAQQAADDRLRSLEVLAGTVPVFGPGIEIDIDDPQGSVTYDLLLNTIQELRDAGAEAIALDGHRVGATTWLGGAGHRVEVDGAPVEAPYVLDAIGDPPTLDSGLRIPGGAVDALTALTGVALDVHREARVDLPALSRPPSLAGARPVGSPA